MDPKEVFIQLQLEVIELQASSVCKIKHRESSLLDFYRNLNSDKYKNPVQLAKKKLSIFGNTYICKPVAQPGFLHGGRGPTFFEQLSPDAMVKPSGFSVTSCITSCYMEQAQETLYAHMSRLKTHFQPFLITDK